MVAIQLNDSSRVTETYKVLATVAVPLLYDKIQQGTQSQEFERDPFIQEFAATTLHKASPLLRDSLNIHTFEPILRSKLRQLETSYN